VVKTKPQKRKRRGMAVAECDEVNQSEEQKADARSESEKGFEFGSNPPSNFSN
jgi:hypothetical protein